MCDDQDGRVQVTGGSTYRVPFAEEGSGCYWSVDLAPGPRGYLGQVLFHVDDERWLNGWVVADSLTDFIVNIVDSDRPMPTGARYDDRGRFTVPTDTRMNATAVADLSEADPDDVEVLDVNDQVELAPLSGSQRLRTLHLKAMPTDPHQLLNLPALQYLSADLPVWQALLKAGAVPPTLAAAGFHEDADLDWQTQFAVMNALLASRGQAPLVTTRIRYVES